MDELIVIIARATLVGAGLVGGTLFGFSAFIMTALGRLPDAQGARAMQAINDAVYSAWFMAPFFGTSLLSACAATLGVMNLDREWSAALIVGGALFFAGVFLTTAVVHVPMNKRLGRASLEDESGLAYWRRYGVVWTRWNHVRWLASIGSVVALSLV